MRCAATKQEAGQPVRAVSIPLDISATSSETFTAIGLSCLNQLLSNREAVIDGEAEGIHQMLVGLRRLRAAISLFEPLLRHADTEAVKRELKWLTDQLGPAREYEVLRSEIGCALCVRLNRTSARFRVLNQELRIRRKTGLDKARKAVASDRFRELGLRTALWLASGAWSRGNDPLARARRERPAANFAADVLARRTRKILKKIDGVADLAPRKRHKLRIAVKKLRYSSDFFGPLFGTKKQNSRRKAFEKALTLLQDSLGALNDIEMHRRFAKSIVHARRPLDKKAEKPFAMGFITGVERKQAEKCLAQGRNAGRELAVVTPFWH